MRPRETKRDLANPMALVLSRIVGVENLVLLRLCRRESNGIRWLFASLFCRQLKPRAFVAGVKIK